MYNVNQTCAIIIMHINIFLKNQFCFSLFNKIAKICRIHLKYNIASAKYCVSCISSYTYSSHLLILTRGLHIHTYTSIYLTMHTHTHTLSLSINVFNASNVSLSTFFFQRTACCNENNVFMQESVT